MILDKQNMFSEDQAVTVTANSTNVIDLGNDSARVQALNEGGHVQIFAQVTEDFAGGTSVQVGLYKDDDENFGSEVLVKESLAVPLAELLAGYQFELGSLPRIDKQYLRMKYTVVGVHTAGKIESGLVLERQTAYA